jgi:hypothetical protein
MDIFAGLSLGGHRGRSIRFILAAELGAKGMSLASP